MAATLYRPISGANWRHFRLGFKTVDGVADMDGRRSAFFEDSEGNLLGMVEYA